MVRIALLLELRQSVPRPPSPSRRPHSAPCGKNHESHYVGRQPGTHTPSIAKSLSPFCTSPRPSSAL